MTNPFHLESHSAIPPGQAIAQFMEVPPVLPPHVLAAYELLLDDEEQHRQRSFRFSADRQLYVAAHALLRWSLSRHTTDIHPQDWRFEIEEHGRPELAAHQVGADRTRFNLSHTRGLAACAITRNCEVGIDVECLDRTVNSQSLASRYFSPHETKQLAKLPKVRRQRQFLVYWTLKEAYVKACGGGLTIPLNSFSFHQDSNGQWRINFESRRDESAAWQFICMYPTANHVLSIAVRRQDQTEFTFDVRPIAPFCEEPFN